MERLLEQHTVRRYDGELTHLHDLVVEMGALVVSQVRSALSAFHRRDGSMAQQVIDRDDEIDQLEVKADDAISSIIALRAPVANDLRFVMAASKSVAELGQIGDEAAKIASLVPFAIADGTCASPDKLAGDVQRMGELALESLQDGVAILDTWNEFQAHKVMAHHRDLDKAFETILGQLMTHTAASSREVGLAMSLVLATKSLERIGHHTENLTEYVMLQVKGELTRDRGP